MKLAGEGTAGCDEWWSGLGLGSRAPCSGGGSGSVSSGCSAWAGAGSDSSSGSGCGLGGAGTISSGRSITGTGSSSLPSSSTLTGPSLGSGCVSSSRKSSGGERRVKFGASTSRGRCSRGNMVGCRSRDATRRAWTTSESAIAFVSPPAKDSRPSGSRGRVRARLQELPSRANRPPSRMLRELLRSHGRSFPFLRRAIRAVVRRPSAGASFSAKGVPRAGW